MNRAASSLKNIAQRLALANRAWRKAAIHTQRMEADRLAAFPVEGGLVCAGTKEQNGE